MRIRFIVLAIAIAAAAFWFLAPTLTGKPADQLLADAGSYLAAMRDNSIRPATVAAPKAGAAAAPAVTVSQPVVREIVEWDELTGRFDAVDSVEIRARVGGYLTDVLFKDGQDVKKGDVLILIDPRPYERALAQAQAELAQAQTRVSNANLDVDRARPLVEKRIVSEKLFDDRENVLREAQAQVRVAEEKVKSAELDLSFTKVVAPVSGRVGRALVTVGNYVTAGGVSGASTLAVIVSQDPIYLYFDITEADALKYKRLSEKAQGAVGAAGSRVEAALPDDTGFPHVGVIDFLDNRLDVATGSLKARARFDNPTRLFTPGLFARLRLQASLRYPAILVPDEAIGADQSNRYVVVVGEGDIPTRKQVQLGPLVDGLRVVRQGVDPQDWVVVKGLTRVRQGQKVMPRREPVSVKGSADAGTPTKVR